MRWAWVLALVGLSFVTGCADLNYDRVKLGMTYTECERALPEGTLWRTELGFCYRQETRMGRTDALVVLLGQDQRVAGKVQATGYPAMQRVGSERGFRLRGELDPSASALSAAGPVDALRAITSDLVNYRGARPAIDAHAWVAAGLVRLIERWPHVRSAGPEFPSLADTLERVPGGGEARISVDPRGVYRFEYRQPNTP